MASRRGAAAAPQLQLAGASPAFWARVSAPCVDALPYADALPPDWRDRAEALVAAELRSAPASLDDYLAALPPAATLTFKVRARARAAPHRRGAGGRRLATRTPSSPLPAHPPPPPLAPAHLPKGCPLIAADVARRASGAPLPPPDGARYRLEPPPPEAGADAWRAACANAASQLGHQQTRLQNLELLVRHGGAAWRAAADAAERAAAAARRDVESLAAAVTALNQTRAVQQRAAGGRLERLEAAWRAAVAKNAAIEAECERMEAEAAERALEGGDVEAAAAGGGGGEGAAMEVEDGAAARGAEEGAEGPAGAANGGGATG